MKSSRLIAFLAVTSCFGAWALAASPAPTDAPLTILLSKSTYTPLDAFAAVVTNRSNQPAKYLGMAIEQRAADGSWRVIRHATNCPCRAKCGKKWTHLKPGKTRSETWDFIRRTKRGRCERVGSGTYRATILRWTRLGPGQRRVLGRSQPFAVKP